VDRVWVEITGFQIRTRELGCGKDRALLPVELKRERNLLKLEQKAPKPVAVLCGNPG
jgi:hypothetical protein